MKIRILHIADLHYSQRNQSDIKKITKELLSDLDRLKREHDITPDLVFFCGDLINKGENSDLDYSQSRQVFIDPLLKYLNLTPSQLFVVPGNHEVDWTKISEVFENGLNNILKNDEIFTEYYRQLKLQKNGDMCSIRNKLEKYFDFNSTLIDKSTLINSTFFYNTFKIQIEKFSIGIICLNSAWRSSQFGEDKGRLIIGRDVINDALEDIIDCDFKFALAHHSLDMLSSWDQKEIKLSLIKNIDILFTGHIHNSEFSFIQPVLGSLYISTCASIFSGRIKNGFSILEIDCEKKNLLVYLRKWYPDREEFDQETDKCKDGLIKFEGYICSNGETDKKLKLLSNKNEIKERLLPPSIILPFDGIKDIALKDVFVEPIISDHSSFDKDISSAKIIGLKNILSSNDNIIFYSKKEYGKTTLLKYLQTELLSDDESYTIPVFISFMKIPKNNYRSIVRLIRQSIDNVFDDKEVIEYLENGNILLLIDDYDNFIDDDRDKKRSVFIEFCEVYPKCRYIITMNEKPAQIYKQESYEINQILNLKNYYLCSFKTAEIRKLLDKWATFQRFNVDKMLRQIIFYFQQLQIPVTPMAVTLFLGVLIKDHSSTNINNEAYLIENYLETILEKLNPDDTRADIDFRDKESFLAHIAYRMMEIEKFEWSKMQFEKEKIDYYDHFGEDIPSHKIFEGFFINQILQEVNGLISFKFRFWFNFFLAKAMQKDNKKKQLIINSPKYLHYSSALAYKAGLDRNDLDLLRIIDEQTQTRFVEFFQKYYSKSINDLEIGSLLIEFNQEVEKEVRSKNDTKEIDSIDDEKYLSYDENDQDIEEGDDVDDVLELITLNSDIIRNTSEISNEYKKEYLKNNVAAYIILMWQAAETFKEFISNLDKETIRNILLQKVKNERNIDEEYLLQKVKEIVLQIIPISIIQYMSDHLSTPKLKNTILDLSINETNIDKRVFYSLLLLRININSAISEIRNVIERSKSSIIDYIILLYLLFFCLTNKLNERDLDELIKIMNKIRSNYKIQHEKLLVFKGDTFASDLKKEVLKRSLRE